MRVLFEHDDMLRKQKRRCFYTSGHISKVTGKNMKIASSDLNYDIIFLANIIYIKCMKLILIGKPTCQPMSQYNNYKPDDWKRATSPSS